MREARVGASLLAALAGVALLLVVTTTQRSKSVQLISAKTFAEVAGPVNFVRRVAFAVPAREARTQVLVSTDKADAPLEPLSPAEEARCVGLLHACQTWLELKDGEKNSIVITSPTDAKKELVNHDIVLPTSGSAIPSKTWGVMQEACKYGLSDLATCDKPTHWPQCSGAECNTDAAKDREDARAKDGDEPDTTLIDDSDTSPKATKTRKKRGGTSNGKSNRLD